MAGGGGQPAGGEPHVTYQGMIVGKPEQKVMGRRAVLAGPDVPGRKDLAALAPGALRRRQGRRSASFR